MLRDAQGSPDGESGACIPTARALASVLQRPTHDWVTTSSYKPWMQVPSGVQASSSGGVKVRGQNHGFPTSPPPPHSPRCSHWDKCLSFVGPQSPWL